MKRLDSSVARIYGPLAKRLGKASEPERIRQLVEMKAEIIEETVEHACAIVASSEDAETAARVRKLLADMHLSDTFFQNNRRQTRRAEAYLLAAGITQVPMAEVQRHYDAKDGVDVFVDAETGMIQIVPQPKKWEYE